MVEGVAKAETIYELRGLVGHNLGLGPCGLLFGPPHVLVVQAEAKAVAKAGAKAKAKVRQGYGFLKYWELLATITCHGWGVGASWCVSAAFCVAASLLSACLTVV